MSAPYPYRVKGTGDVREIYDGDRLVGTIERRQREAVRWRGSNRSITISKTTETWWRGSWPDGSPVLKADGKRATAETIARWRTPRLWSTP